MLATADTTRLLTRASQGDGGAAARLFPLIYDELRDLARRQINRKFNEASAPLEPTAMVHEVFLRMVDAQTADFNTRTHFYAVAATALRQVIVDQFRRRRRQKRGGDLQRITLSDSLAVANGVPVDLIAMEEALTRFSALDERAARVVELRFFGGLTELEIATALHVSERTVRDDWSMARAWLRCALAESPEEHAS